MEKPSVIRLYGYLGAKFGRVHRFVISSPADAIRALVRMVPGFERELMTAKDRGVRYSIFVDKLNIPEDTLAYPSGGSDVRIAPVAHGRKAGLWQTIAGAALFVVGAVSTYFGNAYGPSMMAMGASMALGGIAQMLTRQPSSNTGTSKTSYYFSGAENNTSQGGPVPLLYGRMRVGSTVLSESILATDT
ncbi:tail assembly protein [Robbsia andropogonis]|uniref:tail assembly protein n=1 Tax=Robbsia andropogonis TaxID=28092 RepID=UPI002A699779|nr:tail assembly protein [Robbsia andropogonis]